MDVRDIMTHNVVTIPSSTSIADARRIMEAHRCRRLPVVDKGKLVGIITGHRLESGSSSKATSLTVSDSSYLLDKTPVREVMQLNVITVSPGMSAEGTLALAQIHNVGSLVVVEDGRVVGILTLNDFIYRVVNPALGLGQPGSRIEVTGGGEGKALEEIISTINRLGLEITTLHIEKLPEMSQKGICVQINGEDVSQLMAELESKGYSARLRPR